MTFFDTFFLDQMKVSPFDRGAVLSTVTDSCVSFTGLILTDWFDHPESELPT